VIEIPLTQGLVALVDDEDACRAGFAWRALRIGRVWYAARTAIGPDGKRRTVYLHREILGAPAGAQVDHVDGDGLNNCRANLRPATHVENGRNRQRNANSTSGFKGASWHAQKQRWQASVRVNGRLLFLGHHDTAEEAARAYDAAAAKHFGAFARLNFPEDK
jgi:hypothetical protein